LSSVGIDALFIPDRFDVASLIALKLPDFNLRGIPLLGTHLWNDTQVVEKTGNYEGKILFVDGFFKSSRYGFVQEFVDIFYQTYGKEPGIFEATGYDTMNILLFLLREKKIVNREALRSALINIKGYPGVTGATSFNEKGESKKVLYYLTIQNGTIQQIN
jgi:ABC-type branched-subunit amino acid transport system substrate-binding protein